MRSAERISFEQFVRNRFNEVHKDENPKKEYDCLDNKEKDDYRRNVIQQLAKRINFLLDREFIDRDGYCAVPIDMSVSMENLLNSKYPRSFYKVESMKEELAHIRRLNKQLDGFPADEKREKKELYEWLIGRYVTKYDNYVQRNFIDYPMGKVKLFIEISKEEYELFDLLLLALSTGFMKRKNKKWEDVDIAHRMRILELLNSVNYLPNWRYIELSIDDAKKRLLFPELYRVEELFAFIMGVFITDEGCKQYYEEEKISKLLTGAEKKLKELYSIFDEKEQQEVKKLIELID